MRVEGAQVLVDVLLLVGAGEVVAGPAAEVAAAEVFVVEVRVLVLGHQVLQRAVDLLLVLARPVPGGREAHGALGSGPGGPAQF